MKKRIIIFDDDSDILEVCALILKSRDFDVQTETSCDELIKKVLAYAPDVIIMDNKIPTEGGVLATQRIKREFAAAHIPVIFFSANTYVEALSKQAEADYFLQKPFDITELEELIEKIFNYQSVQTF